MKIPPWVPLYGDPSFRGDCPTESAEQATLINRLRREFPATLGKIVVHIKNEGKRYGWQADRDRALGMTTGACDIIIPGNPTLMIELKRRDHTKSRFQAGQLEYMKAAQAAGAIVCVALGADAAMEAIMDWS